MRILNALNGNKTSIHLSECFYDSKSEMADSYFEKTWEIVGGLFPKSH